MVGRFVMKTPEGWLFGGVNDWLWPLRLLITICQGALTVGKARRR